MACDVGGETLYLYRGLFDETYGSKPTVADTWYLKVSISWTFSAAGSLRKELTLSRGSGVTGRDAGGGQSDVDTKRCNSGSIYQPSLLGRQWEGTVGS